MLRNRVLAALTIVAALGLATPAGAQDPEPTPCDGCYVPPVTVDWNYELSSTPASDPAYELWIVDMFDTEASKVQELRDTGGHVACYISAGSWERWRPDKADYPKSVRGRRIAGWPGERWLDIRALDVLQPLINARLDRCKDKGFEAVDFDNVDAYHAPTGFPLRARDQLAFNRWLAQAAHEHGLSVGLKNDGEQIPELVDYFDFAIVEQCFAYKECGLYKPFVDAGKAVLEVEYSLKRSEFCAKSKELGFRSIKKKADLGAWRRAC